MTALTQYGVGSPLEQPTSHLDLAVFLRSNNGSPNKASIELYFTLDMALSLLGPVQRCVSIGPSGSVLFFLRLAVPAHLQLLFPQIDFSYSPTPRLK